VLDVRRLIAVLVVVCGVGLIVFTLASSAFLRTSEGERLLVRFRGVTTAQGFGAFHDAYAETADAINELHIKDYPVFARNTQFSGYVQSNFSAVASGIDSVEALPSLIGPVANGVAALPDGKFEPTYDLPVKWLPLTSVPWILLGLGLVLVVAGVGIWLLPGRLALAAVLAVGLGMIVVPFAISLPSKVSQTGRVVDLASVGLSAHSATRSEQSSYAADGMVRQLNAEFLPTVAKQRRISIDQLNQQLRSESPALSKFLGDWSTLAPANFSFAADIRESVAEFREVKKFPFEAIPWIVVGLGILLFLAAGLGLVPKSKALRSEDGVQPT
jgi:hypothetical protein